MSLQSGFTFSLLREGTDKLQVGGFRVGILQPGKKTSVGWVNKKCLFLYLARFRGKTVLIFAITHETHNENLNSRYLNLTVTLKYSSISTFS